MVLDLHILSFYSFLWYQNAWSHDLGVWQSRDELQPKTNSSTIASIFKCPFWPIGLGTTNTVIVSTLRLLTVYVFFSPNYIFSQAQLHACFCPLKSIFFLKNSLKLFCRKRTIKIFPEAIIVRYVQLLHVAFQMI
jgi:hypothetical protein